MGMLLGILGFLGLIVGIILFVLGLIHKKKYKGGFIALISLVFIVIGLIITPTPDEKASSPSNSKADSEDVDKTENVAKEEEKPDEDPVEEVVEEVEPVELTPQQQMIQDIISLIDANKAFDAGSYTKGDIPPGDYAFVPFEGSGQYYVEKDLAGNILDNENFDSFGYVHVHDVGNIETQGVLISIDAFETLGVSNAKEIYEIVNDVEGYNQAGWYKVGVDLPAGTYTIESFGEGYVAIMSGPVGNSDIVDNENFNGKYTVNVSDGQFLKVSSGQIIK